MVELKNSEMTVSINPLGAELSSVVRRGIQYIWQADPAVWKRHAPLLFPIVGRLKDQRYTIGGKQYNITQHGFGRDLLFDTVRESDSCACFVITANAYTKAMYPYDFRFTVRYSLNGDTLKKEHITENLTNEFMYYEVGGHDAYNLCLTGDSVTDSYLLFANEDGLSPVTTDKQVFLTQAHGELPLQNHRLYLNCHTFAHDAIILDNLRTRKVTLASDQNEHQVIMQFDDFPYLGLWSIYKDYAVPYVCIEPWSSLPDTAYLGYELENKIGIRRLAPKQTETLTFQTTFL